MVSVLIVAAGSGARMGPGTDKLFLTLAGKPVLAHTWMRFDRNALVDEIILVVRSGAEPAFQALAGVIGCTKPYRLVPGGAERQDSVWNGLTALHPQTEWVAIQDGARPCTPPGLLEATLEAARTSGAAVAAQRVTDTIKESTDGRFIAAHLERTRLWAVQTPQTFRVEVIRRALAKVREQGLQVTDDTAACGLVGHPVQLVPASAPNPKLTTPEDLPYLEALLARETSATPAPPT